MGIAGTGTFPVYPSPLPVGEPDYLSYHASIRLKEAQHRYFGQNLNNHIYSLCVLGTLVQFFSHHLRQQHKHACLTSARAPHFLSSVSLPPLFVLLATSLLLHGISETPTLIPR